MTSLFLCVVSALAGIAETGVATPANHQQSRLVKVLSVQPGVYFAVAHRNPSSSVIYKVNDNGDKILPFGTNGTFAEVSGSPISASITATTITVVGVRGNSGFKATLDLDGNIVTDESISPHALYPYGSVSNIVTDIGGPSGNMNQLFQMDPACPEGEVCGSTTINYFAIKSSLSDLVPCDPPVQGCTRSSGYRKMNFNHREAVMKGAFQEFAGDTYFFGTVSNRVVGQQGIAVAKRTPGGAVSQVIVEPAAGNFYFEPVQMYIVPQTKDMYIAGTLGYEANERDMAVIKYKKSGASYVRDLDYGIAGMATVEFLSEGPGAVTAVRAEALSMSYLVDGTIRLYGKAATVNFGALYGATAQLLPDGSGTDVQYATDGRRVYNTVPTLSSSTLLHVAGSVGFGTGQVGFGSGQIVMYTADVEPISATQKNKISMVNLLKPLGEQKLTAKGEIILPQAIFETLELSELGIQFTVRNDLEEVLFQGTAAPGEYDRDTRVGWKVSTNGLSHRYINNSGSQALYSVSLKKDLKRGLIKFTIKAKNASIDRVDFSELPLSMELSFDQFGGGVSGTAFFKDFPEKPYCRVNTSGSKVSCR